MVESLDRRVEPDAVFPRPLRDIVARNINAHKHFRAVIVLHTDLARTLK
jgi:hypothetical protein